MAGQRKDERPQEGGVGDHWVSAAVVRRGDVERAPHSIMRRWNEYFIMDGNCWYIVLELVFLGDGELT